MKRFLPFVIAALAFTSAAHAEDEEKKEEPEKGASRNELSVTVNTVPIDVNFALDLQYGRRWENFGIYLDQSIVSVPLSLKKSSLPQSVKSDETNEVDEDSFYIYQTKLLAKGMLPVLAWLLNPQIVETDLVAELGGGIVYRDSLSPVLDLKVGAEMIWLNHILFGVLAGVEYMLDSDTDIIGKKTNKDGYQYDESHAIFRMNFRIGAIW